MIVRVHSEGQTLYLLGDLIHHPVEIERPEVMVHWADVEATRSSRRRLIESALAEDARLVATHIVPVGRLERTPQGVVWKAEPET